MFPDLPNLRNTRLWGLEVYDSLNHTPSQTQGVVMTKALLIATTVTLFFDGGEFITIPTMKLSCFAPAAFYFNTPDFAGQQIIWPKCYITLCDPTTVANYATKSFVFNAYYTNKI